MGQMRVGDIGSRLRIRVRKQDSQPFDMSAATVKTLKMMKPSGTVVERSFGLEEASIAFYDMVSGDLDEQGPWQGQLLVEFAGGNRWHTDPFSFEIAGNLS